MQFGTASLARLISEPEPDIHKKTMIENAKHAKGNLLLILPDVSVSSRPRLLKKEAYSISQICKTVLDLLLIKGRERRWFGSDW